MDQLSNMEHLVETRQRSYCEWKGSASYYSIVVGDARLLNVAWTYADPVPAFAPIRNHIAFYPGSLECSVDGERVVAQPGDFYGGWITANVAGPFKGAAGTLFW